MRHAVLIAKDEVLTLGLTFCKEMLPLLMFHWPKESHSRAQSPCGRNSINLLEYSVMSNKELKPRVYDTREPGDTTTQYSTNAYSQ